MHTAPPNSEPHVYGTFFDLSNVRRDACCSLPLTVSVLARRWALVSPSTSRSSVLAASISRSSSSALGARARQLARCQADQLGQPFAVFPTAAGHRKPGFCPRIRQTFREFTDEGFARRRGLHEQLIVAHERDELTATVNAVLAEHLARRDVTSLCHLLQDEVDGALFRSHGSLVARSR